MRLKGKTALITGGGEGIGKLFNNAGILEAGNVLTTSVESWDKTIDINIKGMFLMCKHVIPHMIKKGGGSIINNSSVAGFIGCPNTVAYCTSKGAVMQFTRSLALDHVKEGIRVNTICPGFIKTKMNEDFIGNPPDAQKQLDVMAAQIVPMGKRGEPIDIAYGVLYLASDESRYVTGSSLVIDGGWTTY